jgi:hypothetical protein
MAPMMRTLERTLQTAAAELAELAAIADHLEFDAAVFGRELDDALIERCQLADQLTQRLAGLTAFVAGLAERAPLDVVLDVSEGVAALKLADQAGRLTGAVGRSEPCPAAVSGDVLLFGD